MSHFPPARPVDEDLWVFKKRKSSGRIKMMKAKKLIWNLRPSSESVSLGNNDSYPEYMLVGDDAAREIVKIDETTPRLSARCGKLSQKIMQIKKERQEEIDDQQKYAAKLVKIRKTYHQAEVDNINEEVNERPKDIPAGLRRSRRTRKPPKEMVNFGKELKDDNTGVKRRGSYLNKSKKKLNLSRAEKAMDTEQASSVYSSKQRVRCSSSNKEPHLNNPVGREVLRPPAEMVADVLTITPSEARKLGTLMKHIPPASEHVPAVQVRPLEELLALSSCEDDGTVSPPLKEVAIEDPTNPKKKQFAVLTESEEGIDNEDKQLSPATSRSLIGDMRDWNCFQCVYELTKMDARLTMAELDPLLEKMVDGDALMKSSLSDLVNVVGLQYSPAVRVVFLVQQMAENNTSGEGLKK